MHDDIRPPIKQPFDARTAQQIHQPRVESAALANDFIDTSAVDENKLQQEFGPAWNDAASKQNNGTMLPSLAKWRLSKRELLLTIVGVLIVGAAAVGAIMVHRNYHPKVVQSVTPPIVKKAPPKPTIVASVLSGLPVDPSVNDRPVTAVMIENSLDARPQSGLDQASVVFEALAEGGVTRFMALFQDTQPDYIGPVRSARPYYVQWALGFDAAYAHVGGSPDALADIPAWGVKDMNQFYNAGAYERISTRYAPHNVYTSIAQLNQLEASRGYGKSNVTPLARKQDAPSKAPTATSIDMNFSGYYYNPHFAYNPSMNTYKRSEAGAPHMELHKDGTQVQIAPKVVIAMVVPEHAGALDSSGAYYADYATVGTGQMTVFQDGTVQTGTWSKTANNAPLTFADANGKPFAFNAGQVWISALPNATSLTYK